MEKRIEVCIGTDRAGGVRARLSLLMVDDAGRLLSEHYHSIAIEPGADLAALRKANEVHLAMTEGSGIPGAPWPAIPDAEWAKVERVCAIFHTPEVVAAHQARVAAQLAAQAESQLRAAMAGGRAAVQ